MYSKTLSSKVKIKTSELPPEALRRYGFADESPELDLSRAAGHRRQDQHLKDGITNTLYRLELDNVKPGLDVLAQTGFRRSHYLRRHSPGEDEILLTAAAAPHRGRRPARPYSYIEPRLLLHRQVTRSPGRNDFEVKLRKSSPDRSVEIRERAGSVRPSSTASWYYTEPTGYSYLHGVYPTHLRPVWEPEGGRVLSDYRDAVAASPPLVASHRQRWSVYGPSAPGWTRSQSTPPGRHERSSSSSVVRQPIVGNHLTRTKNREYSVGVKLAESQTELDNFSRLLDKNFGGENSLPWRSSYGVYPFYAHYNYLEPRIPTEYRVYSPRTRVTRPPEKRSAAYSTSEDYVPYTDTYYYSSHVPSAYSYSDYLSEPWYLPYYSRGGYYTGGSYLSPLVGRYSARYLY